ncbi:MAG: RNA pyrophosphohydrolase [Gammaproteobacteria bacterium]
MIDSDGYRANVGIIVSNGDGLVLIGKRVGQRAWQFPQGGIRRQETPEEAMYRELREEVGLCRDDVELMGFTRDWLRYRLPRRLVRWNSTPLCIGQKQVWFMLRMLGEDDRVQLDFSDKPEFDNWRWVKYWHPANKVVSFKRQVYRLALRELAPLLSVDCDGANASAEQSGPPAARSAVSGERSSASRSS